MAPFIFPSGQSPQFHAVSGSYCPQPRTRSEGSLGAGFTNTFARSSPTCALDLRVTEALTLGLQSPHPVASSLSVK